MTKLHELHEHGQSIWVDYIRRDFLAQGELQMLLDQGVRGVTSNPTIFEKAIAGSADYDTDLRRLVAEGALVDAIYETLVLADIARAADILHPLYSESGGGDGYISLEVSPTLAHDTAGTIAEARRLHAALGRPNVMIKVPATAEGIPAITDLIGAGISINVTLIFSLAQYEAVVEAYMRGLEQRAAAGETLDRIASVASFFVSRVDTAVDRLLAQRGLEELQGQAAIANARLAYARFKELFSGSRWAALAARGAAPQRPLWASTGTKDPRLPDTRYVDSLIGPHTVNTVPPATLTAFLDHGAVAATLEQGVAEAHALFAQLAGHGIDLGAVTRQLQDEGVASFAASFDALMASIAAKRAQLGG
jgi:transaldolase